MSPDRYAIKLVISGILGVLAKSNIATASTLEDQVLAPLLHHMQAHELYKHKAESQRERARHGKISAECMTWHAHLESVLNGLK